jgi:uncharacterized membrane protein YeaQ/YmgE (transglycosylase-associated protein family)
MNGILALFATVLGGWIVVNLIGALIVGAIARAVLPGKDRVGWGKTLLIGFLGGILGKLAVGLLRWYSGFPMGFVASVLGAAVLLLAHRAFLAGKRGAPAS